MSSQDCPKKSWPLPLFLGRGNQTSTLLTHKELKLTAIPTCTSICSALLPDCRTLYPQYNCVFQQDHAPCHTSRTSQDYLTENTNRFMETDIWPPQSADCNPMDYAIWDMLSEKVYAGRRHKFTVPELKEKKLKILSGEKSHRNLANINLVGKRESSL